MEVLYRFITYIQTFLNATGNVFNTLFGVRIYNVSYDKVLSRLDETQRQLVKEDSVLDDRLRFICWCLSRDGRHSLFGRIVQTYRIRDSLDNLVRLRRLMQDDPSLQQVPIVKPVFIINFPRTASTLVHRLLACDDQFVAPKAWEMEHATDLKGKKCPKYTSYTAVFPESKYGHMHTMAVDDVDDASFLLLDRRLMFYDCGMNFPEVSEHLLNLDRQSAHSDYQALKEYLQLIIAHRDYKTSKRLLIKCHGVNVNLPALLDVFPDAQFIMGHRTVTSMVASTLSMSSNLTKVLMNDFDPTVYGATASQHLFHAGCKHIQGRRQVYRDLSEQGLDKNDVFIDVSFKDLVKDPMAQMKDVYGKLDMTLSPSVERAMNTWLQNNKKDKNGKHVYSLDQFGLSEDQVNEQWTWYKAYFKDYL